MKPGDLVVLRSEDEIVWDDSFLEWDHTLLFSSREDARDMRRWIGGIAPGTLGTILEVDPNFVRVHTPSGTGWNRKHYWRIVDVPTT
jgi:hypothetical protein